MASFELSFLDHVAVRVQDLERSALWYEKVLGLKRKRVPEWDPFPVFLFAGKTGIALFPAKREDKPLSKTSKAVKIDHFAFRVEKSDFDKVRSRYEELGLDFKVQDHHYFQSIYTFDPDGHQVEVTCLIREDFF